MQLSFRKTKNRLSIASKQNFKIQRNCYVNLAFFVVEFYIDHTRSIFFCRIQYPSAFFQKQICWNFVKQNIIKNSNFDLVRYIKAVNTTGFVYSQTYCTITEEMDTRWRNGDKFSRNYVTPPEVWRRIIVWEIKTGINLPSFRVL